MSLQMLSGHGLILTLMVYPGKNTSCKETAIGLSTLFQVINTLDKVQCQLIA